MTTAETHTQKRYWRWAGGALLLVLCVLLIAGIGGWLARKSIAQSFLKSYCSERGVDCAVQFQELGLHNVILKDLKVTRGDQTPVEVEQIHILLDWPSLGVPKLSSAILEKPILRAVHDGERFDLGGLEALIPKGSDGGGEPLTSTIAVNDGKAILETPAGDVTAQINAAAKLPDTGEANITIDPVSLTTQQGTVDLKEGRIDLDLNPERITGELDFDLASAQYSDMALEGIEVKANVAGLNGASGPVTLNWTANIASAETAMASTVRTVTSGEAKFSSVPEASVQAIFDALNMLVADVETGPISAGGVSADTLSVQVDLANTEDGISGPMALNAGGFASGPLTAGTLRATGDVSRSSASGVFTFTGDTSLAGTKLSPVLLKPVRDALKVPQPFADHGQALSRALARASDKFDLALNIQAELGEDGLAISSRRATSIRSASGLILSVRPIGQSKWLVYDQGALELTGQIAISGGGAPALTANLDRFETSDTAFKLQARSIDLEPWSAAGKTLGADLARINMSRNGSVTRLAGQGQVSIAGPIPGAKLETTTLTGGIDAATDRNGWRMQMLGSDCIGFASGGIDFGAIKIDPVATDFCPEDGRFIRQSAGTPEGRVLLGDIRLPFKTGSGGGILSLSNAGVDWSADNGLSMTVTSNSFLLPLTIGERTLTIDGASPSMGVFIGDGPLRLLARLAETDFGGSMVPANVSAGSFEFNGRSTDGGISGSLKANSVEIADIPKPDPNRPGQLLSPVYQPLIADFEATLDNRQLSMTGPVRLRRGGITVADTRLDIDVVSLDGTAGVVTRDLNFNLNGLQPAMLSDLLRGAFTNANGLAKGAADFTISKGALAGTGQFSVEEFGFQTTSLGRVEGVNGKVEFSDLMKLTTPPGQAVSIKSMSPGVPLTDGEIVFQLVGGKEARLQAASFPFAGGRLFASPTVWTLGGQKQTVQVEVSNVELERIIDVFQLPDVKATGTLSGRFPILIENSNVFIRDAKLAVDEQGGTLAYTGTAADAAAQNNEWTKLAFDALRDLDYTVLELGFDGNVTGEMNVTLALLGRNLDVLGGSVFKFNIAVDSPLFELIQSRRYYGDQSWLADVVAEQVISDRAAETPAN